MTLAVNAPGPTAAARLTSLGARVVKVEPPEGDPMERYCAAWYRHMKRGQKVVRLNLKQARDRARFERLLAQSDLLLTAQRPAALARLGLDWRHLHAHFPRLCQVALIGHPPPREHIAGHDLTYMAEAGLLEPPQLPMSVFADLAAAERMVSEAAALLLARERTSRGGYAQVSIAAAAHDLALPLRLGMTAPGGLLGGSLPGYQVYRARTGWVAVAAPEPHFWQRLLDRLGLKEGTKRELGAAFRKRSAEEWQRWAAAHDLPVAAVRAPRATR